MLLPLIDNLNRVSKKPAIYVASRYVAGYLKPPVKL